MPHLNHKNKYTYRIIALTMIIVFIAHDALLACPDPDRRNINALAQRTLFSEPEDHGESFARAVAAYLKMEVDKRLGRETTIAEIEDTLRLVVTAPPEELRAHDRRRLRFKGRAESGEILVYFPRGCILRYVNPKIHDPNLPLANTNILPGYPIVVNDYIGVQLLKPDAGSPELVEIIKQLELVRGSVHDLNTCITFFAMAQDMSEAVFSVLNNIPKGSEEREAGEKVFILLRTIHRKYKQLGKLNREYSELRNERHADRLANSMELIKVAREMFEIGMRFKDAFRSIENVLSGLFDKYGQKEMWDSIMTPMVPIMEKGADEGIGKIQNLESQLAGLYTKEPLDLIEVVKTFIDAQKNHLNGNSCSVEISNPIAFDEAMIVANRVDIERVLRNLIENAIESMNEKEKAMYEAARSGYVKRINIEISYDADNTEVVLRVRDNGLGMSEDVRAKLFKKEIESGITTKPRRKEFSEGGIGVPTIRWIIENEHHGKVDATSEPGAWTEFTIRLPAYSDAVQLKAAGKLMKKARPIEEFTGSWGSGVRTYMANSDKDEYKYLLTRDISMQDLPEGYPAALRQLNPSKVSPEEINVNLPDPTIFLASRAHNGNDGVVRLGWLDDGTPIGIKAYYTDSVEIDNGRINSEYAEALVADGLGIGPRVHGLFRDKYGRVNIVMDIVPGDFWDDMKEFTTPATIKDLMEINTRLVSSGRSLDFHDMQYFITPYGRVLLIDVDNLNYYPNPDSSNYRYVEEMISLLASAGNDVQVQALTEIASEDSELFDELEKIVKWNVGLKENIAKVRALTTSRPASAAPAPEVSEVTDGERVIIIPPLVRKLMDKVEPIDEYINLSVTTWGAYVYTMMTRCKDGGWIYTKDISALDLPTGYPTALRQLDLSKASPGEINVNLPELNIFLASREHSGTDGVVRLGWLDDGTPVAIKAYYSNSGSDAKDADNIKIHNELENVLLADRLGIGPRVHGLFHDNFGRVNIVMDIVPGDFLDKMKESITVGTIMDLMEINDRLTSNGRSLDFPDRQYFITSEGRILFIDVDYLNRSVHHDDTYWYAEILEPILANAENDVQVQALTEIASKSHGLFDELEKMVNVSGRKDFSWKELANRQYSDPVFHTILKGNIAKVRALMASHPAPSATSAQAPADAATIGDKKRVMDCVEGALPILVNSLITAGHRISARTFGGEVKDTEKKKIGIFIDKELGGDRVDEVRRAIVKLGRNGDQLLTDLLDNVTIYSSKTISRSLGHLEKDMHVAKEDMVIIANDNKSECLDPYKNISTITEVKDRDLLPDSYYPLLEIVLFAIARHSSLHFTKEELAKFYKAIPNIDIPANISDAEIAALFWDNEKGRPKNLVFIKLGIPNVRQLTADSQLYEEIRKYIAKNA